MKLRNSKEGWNVLSLFNGMSTLNVAFNDSNIKVNKYYSSEIKPAAIELTQHHQPDTIQLGSIENWQNWKIDWQTIDFIGSGSPCQDLSIAGNRKGVEKGERSNLFFVFVDILNHVKKFNPDVLFLQENVGSATAKDVGIMSRAMGVYSVNINSKLVTAQLRNRIYWSNIRVKKFGMFGDFITDIPQPKDENIFFKDIIENGYTDRKKARAVLEGDSRPHKNMKLKLKRYIKPGFGNVVFLDKELTTVRLLNKVEMCRLQGFKDDYCDILNTNDAVSLLGDGWTLPVITHILKYIKD